MRNLPIIFGVTMSRRHGGPQVGPRTVPFNSVRQSRVTGPSKSPKCHVGHGNFYKVPKSFCDLALKYRFFLPPAAQNCGNFPNVTVSLGGCRNQNFVRRVTRHMGCRSELNGTVLDVLLSPSSDATEMENQGHLY